MDEGEAEAIAWRASVESGLDDRPNADPCVLAVGYLGLRLAPIAGAKPHLVGDVIYYPANACEQTRAYMCGHEAAHALLRMEGWNLELDDEERAASRIACAWLLPKRAFLRDMHATGRDVAALSALWPLATSKIIRRRIDECEISYEMEIPAVLRGAR